MKLMKNKLLLGTIVLFLIGMAASALLTGKVIELAGSLHVLLSWLLSLIPALLWLWLFYHHDKYEKEPKQFIFGVFILGALMTYAIAIPLENLLRTSILSSGNPHVVKLLSLLLSIALVQETVKFVAVRLTVFNSSHFNEPADAMVYMISAGIGAAFVYNVVYFNSLEAVNLGVVIARIVEFYITSAVFAGISGYFMGLARFGKKYLTGELLMFAGVLLASAANVANDLVKKLAQGMNYNALTELLVSVTFSLIILMIMLFLLRKSVEKSPFKPINQ
jgi:protease PrsW